MRTSANLDESEDFNEGGYELDETNRTQIRTKSVETVAMRVRKIKKQEISMRRRGTVWIQRPQRSKEPTGKEVRWKERKELQCRMRVHEGFKYTIFLVSI